MDRGGADVAGEEGHFSDSLAAADIAYRARFPVVLSRGAEASAHHDIHGIGAVAFAEEDFAGGEFFPANVREKLLPDRGLEAAEFLVENFAEEGGVGFLQSRVDVHRRMF
jgi:hypothetical protein